MSDIFISYAKEDRPALKNLANALTGYGWSVFWDPTIPAGKTWRQVIGNEIENARCVIVAWSGNSNNSHWVLEESEIGRERGVLIPILIENVMPPLGFRSLQAANISDWDGNPEDPNFKRLISDITAVLGQAPASSLANESKSSSTSNENIAKTRQSPEKKINVSADPRLDADKSPSNLKYFVFAGAVVIIALLAVWWFNRDAGGYTTEEDQVAWIAALERNDPEGFMVYLEDYPNGQYIADAEFLMDSLNEVFTWREVLEGNSVEAYTSYKERWPQGKFIDEAEKAIEKLKDEDRRARQITSVSNENEAWEQAVKQNTIAAFKAYQEKYPNGKYFTEARRRMSIVQSEQRKAKIEEEDARTWEAALEAGNISSLQQYQERFPKGIHFEEASERIAKMKSIPVNTKREQEVQKVSQINGRNVKAISFGHNKDEILGGFLMKGNKYWVETGTRGEVRYEFKEMERDEWSVYLEDPSRKVRIQLNLHSRKVMYAESGKNFRDLYNIFSVK